MSADGQPVIDYSFVTSDLLTFFETAKDHTADGVDRNKITNPSSFIINPTKLFAVPSNYMQVTNPDYYIPTDM